MSLLERTQARPAAPIHGSPCSVGALRESLPPSEQAALDRIMWDLPWTDPQRHAEITEDGHDVKLSQIGKHRRGHCRCNKDAK